MIPLSNWSATRPARGRAHLSLALASVSTDGNSGWSGLITVVLVDFDIGQYFGLVKLRTVPI